MTSARSEATRVTSPAIDPAADADAHVNAGLERFVPMGGFARAAID
jgi:hypothetical protein